MVKLQCVVRLPFFFVLVPPMKKTSSLLQLEKHVCPNLQNTKYKVFFDVNEPIQFLSFLLLFIKELF